MRPTGSRLPFLEAPALAVLALSLALLEARAQISYKEVGLHSIAQRALPSTGPGSALLNPAALGETRLAFGQRGTYATRSGIYPSILYFGEDLSGFYQVAATLPPSLLPGIPVAFSAGFAVHLSALRIDGSNALYRESVYQPGLAVSWPADRDSRQGLSLGAALPMYELNAFGAVKSHSTGLDIGFLGRVSPAGQRLRMGLVLQHLVRPGARLPLDRGGDFELPRTLEASLHWSTPGEMYQIHWERYLWTGHDPAEGPATANDAGIGSCEAEIRPVRWLGLKAERQHDRAPMSLGITLQPVKGKTHPMLEWAFSHERFIKPYPEFLFGETREESLGFVQSMTFTVGI